MFISKILLAGWRGVYALAADRHGGCQTVIWQKGNDTVRVMDSVSHTEDGTGYVL